MDKKIGLIALFLSLSINAFAHDFKVDDIYYNILSETDKTVEVTFRGTSFDDYLEEYKGNVVIPETLTYNSISYSIVSIGYRAFMACSGVTSIAIPNSVKSIEDESFYGCRNLTSITIPNSVTTIGSFAFYGCVGLTSMNIPDSVTSTGNSVFYDCTGLTSVSISNSITNISYSFLHGCSGLTSIIIPNSVTTIGNGAFCGCGLTSITIPNSVTSIGQNAFYQCRSLVSVIIPNTVTNIGDYAFNGCSGLTSVVIPDSITHIGSSLFCGCRSLSYVSIPNTVTSIDNSAFEYCSALTSITIPELVTNIGSRAFSGCYGLKSVIFNAENCSNIGSSSNFAFDGCTSLTKLVVGNKCKVIPENFFRKVNTLKELLIGESVMNIGSNAFVDCKKLERIYSFNTTPPMCADATVFEDVDKENCTLYVPFESVADYGSTYVWMDFLKISGTDFSRIETTLTDNGVNVSVENGNIVIGGADDAVKVEVYSVNGQCVYSGTATTIPVNGKGLYIVVVNGKSHKVML